MYFPVLEFPVGTGIYRYKKENAAGRSGVPCRYRDIPIITTAKVLVNPSSL